MKKLILIPLILLASSCEVKMQGANASMVQQNHDLKYEDLYIQKMHYKLLTYYGVEGGLCTVNITKDSLECEFYRQYLEPVKH